MIRSVVYALWAHWARHKIQLFSVLAGVALATGLWSGVQAINAEARASYDAAAQTLAEGQFDQIVPRQGSVISVSDYVDLRRNGWRVSPVVEGRLNGVRFLGLEPLTSPGRFNVGRVSQETNLSQFIDPGLVFARESTARALDLEVPIIVSPDAPPNMVIGDIGVVSRLLAEPELSRLIVLPEQPVKQRHLDQVTPHLRLLPASQTADIGELTDSFHLNLTAFGFLSFSVGLLIVHSTIGLAFEQRRSVTRTLRALGVPLRVIVTLMSAEIAMLALLGGSLGVVLGYVIAAALLPDVAGALRGLYGADVSGTLQLRPEWWVSGLGIALTGSIAASGAKLWSIARMSPLASARPHAWASAAARSARIQGAMSLLLGICAVALLIWGNSLLAGFATLALFLTAVAFALPSVVRPVTAVAQNRARSVLGQWFWADTRQQLPGLSLALAALLLAVTANIGVTTMVSSFRLTFTTFLDQRLAPELYVQIEDPSEAERLLPVMETLAEEALPLLRVDDQIVGQSVEVLGIRVGPTYRENWVFLEAHPETWDRVETGEAVILNEQFARRAGLWVGDTVPINSDMPIAAVVADYGNPSGQVILSSDAFQELYPEIEPRAVGLRTNDTPDLRARLEAAGVDPEAMTDQASLKRFSLEVFERTFLVTGALNILTLTVAGFAMLMSLLTLADQRLPQLAPVWAAGVTRKTLARLELLRATIFALIVFVVALPAGLGLAWLLLARVNVEAFGWRLPMYLFPADYAQLGALTLAAACLAALWPSLRLARIAPAKLLKVFADAR